MHGKNRLNCRMSGDLLSDQSNFPVKSGFLILMWNSDSLPLNLNTIAQTINRTNYHRTNLQMVRVLIQVVVHISTMRYLMLIINGEACACDYVKIKSVSVLEVQIRVIWKNICPWIKLLWKLPLRYKKSSFLLAQISKFLTPPAPHLCCKISIF